MWDLFYNQPLYSELIRNYRSKKRELVLTRYILVLAGTEEKEKTKMLTAWYSKPPHL